jgi:hypothetical protein
MVPRDLALPTVGSIDGPAETPRAKEGAIAVSGGVQTLPGRRIRFPVGLMLLSVLLTAGVMGALVGRWTAPSTTGAQRSGLTAPGGEAYVPWVTDFPSYDSSGDAAPFVAGVTDFPSHVSSGDAARFVPGVTDFPSHGSSGDADTFAPWVTDFGS